MSYMWTDFNIKTFPAETVVFRNGEYCPELSTLEYSDINTRYKLPVHFIYIGEIAGNNDLFININVKNQLVYLSIDVSNKLPAFLNVFIKNTGEFSELRGHVLLKNTGGELNFICNAGHFAKNTGIFVKTKLVAGKNSISKLSAVADIKDDSTGVMSDISFSALADKSAKIEFLPAQRISATPDIANHSASIYKPTPAQIQFLRSAGLSGAEVDDALRDAFTKDFDLF